MQKHLRVEMEDGYYRGTTARYLQQPNDTSMSTRKSPMTMAAVTNQLAGDRG